MSSLVHGECLYLPGRVEGGSSLRYLLDSGASDNVLSLATFSSLPRRVRKRFYTEEITAKLANGNDLLIHGTITLRCRIRTLAVAIAFRVADIEEEAILGMSFFIENRCNLLLDRGQLKIGDKIIRCVNKHGEVLPAGIETYDRQPSLSSDEEEAAQESTTDILRLIQEHHAKQKDIIYECMEKCEQSYNSLITALLFD